MKRSIRIRKKTWTILAVCAAVCLLQPAQAISSNSRIPANNYGGTNKFLSNNNRTKAIQQQSKFFNNIGAVSDSVKPSCQKTGCELYAEIDKSDQMMYVHIAGELQHSFKVSTGKWNHPTPNMDLRPRGPVYINYASKKYPDGDYMGMGNMPYAVFVKGDYAIHGTTETGIKMLGRRASHGCIRLHPDDAKLFNELVSSAGLENTWITVHP
jgi:lipoprotein-anchoring transpeptidase ErfK/SrfK